MGIRVPFAAAAAPDGDILVSAQATQGGNAYDLAQKILHRLDKDGGGPSNTRSFAMGQDGFMFRFSWAPNGYTFVMLEKDMGDAAVWKALDRCRQRFESAYGEGGGTGMPDDVVIIFPPVTRDTAMSFKPTLDEMIREANRMPAAAASNSASGNGRSTAADDELLGVHDRLEQVRNVMADSIDKVIERGEKIDVLVERADRLEANAMTFAKSSTGLKKSLRWRELKFKLLVGAAIVGGLLFVVSSACDGVFGCLPGGGAVNAAEAEGYSRVVAD